MPVVHRTTIALALAFGGCSEYTVGGLPDRGYTDCDFVPAPPADVASLAECEGPGTLGDHDPWDVVLEWELDLGGTIVSSPVVANLTDDNGDGKVDDGDIPDLVLVTRDTDLIAIQGDGSVEHFRLPGFDGDSGIALGDVDGDGRTEIVARTITEQVVLLDADGQRRWTSDVYHYPVNVAIGYPTLADLDADGLAEVIFDRVILDGSTGALIGDIEGAEIGMGIPHVADLDQDGAQEIVFCGVVSDITGATKWTADTAQFATWTAVADVDGDPGGEVIFADWPNLHALDQDGTPLWTVELELEAPWADEGPGPPCVADLDADGRAEIAVPTQRGLRAYRGDGTLMWQSPGVDGSGAAGCSAYDFDLDGAYEVLYAEEQTFRIHDGRTGEPLYEDEEHASLTGFEYPVVADLDRDGSAEIVVVASVGPIGVRVYGHADGAWPRSGPTWGVHGQAFSAQRPDGSVPTDPEPAWLSPGQFRARPPIDGAGRPALQLEVTDRCVSSCEGGTLTVAWQASNPGLAELPPGATVYLLDADGAVVASTTLGAIPAGGALEGEIFEVDDATGARFTLVGDPGPAAEACIETASVPVETGCPRPQ